MRRLPWCGCTRSNTVSNSYPRVLIYIQHAWAPATVEFYIENGIQLTGMPSTASQHHESAAESWKLTARAMTFGHPQFNAWENVWRSVSVRRYVDSAREVPEISTERWKNTPMANTAVHDPQERQAIL